MKLHKLKSPNITDEMISEIIKKIINNFNPEKIILFGSRVWGTPEDWSDIDLLVIMDYKGVSPKITAQISQIARPPYIPIDIIVRSPQEIQYRKKIGDYFINRILNQGKVLYERKVS